VCIRSTVGFEWDAEKARANLRKHKIDFADAATVLDDDMAVTIPNEDPGELPDRRRRRARPDPRRRVHLARRAGAAHLRSASNPHGTTPIRGLAEMKRQYDFSKGKRGPVIPIPKGKSRITIRIDDETLAWFRKRVHDAGGGSYQTLINDALRTFVADQREPLEETIRRVLREELRRPVRRGSQSAHREV
jgi:uncharacterized protein (DUF4415 family)